MKESISGLFRILFKGLEGQSSSLDANLAAMRDFIASSGGPLPEELIKNIEQDVRILHLEQEESCQDFLDIIHTWQARLAKTDFPAAQKQELRTLLAKEEHDGAARIYQFPALFQVLLSLQCVADDIVKEKVFALDSEDHTRTLANVTTEIINLLRHITPAQASTDSHKALITKLEKGVEIKKIPGVIGEISKLLESALLVKSDDFSVYLQGLNKQLSEVQEYIFKTQSADISQARDIADSQVRDSVQNIRESVSGVEQIEELQEKLSGQLNQIVSAMDVIKAEDKKRESELQSNYDALKLRVSVMEKEAEKVQEFIEEERKQARQDALTGLPNRTAYNEIMAHQIEVFKRYNNPLSIVVCDLDYFKRVNDTYGHLAGDKVLNLIAKILSKGTRSSDYVTRYGGEEFAIIMPSTDLQRAAQVMEKIRRLIGSSPFNYRGEPISISMSFGVCAARENDSIETLFYRADAALYNAKKEGRNRVKIG